MSEDKGKEFLELIDSQNKIQWKIISKLTLLLSRSWNDELLKKELESLVKEHNSISAKINELEI